MTVVRAFYLCLIALLCVSLNPKQALACRGTFSEGHLLLPTLPEQIDDDLIVLKVSLLSAEFGDDRILEAEVLEVVQGDWARERVDLEAIVFTSCTRAMIGDHPMYVVGVASVFEGRLLLREYKLTELLGYERLSDGRERFDLP